MTNKRSCQTVLELRPDRDDHPDVSPIFKCIYTCLKSSGKSAVKFALGTLVNLTLLKDEQRKESCEMIMLSGGMSHIIFAIQKTYNSNELDSMLYGLKALLNLVKYNNPLVKILAAENGYLDTLTQLGRQMYQTVIKSTAQEQGRSDKAKLTKKRND